MNSEVYLKAYRKMCAELREIAPDGRYRFRGTFMVCSDGIYRIPIVRMVTEPRIRVSMVGFGQIVDEEDIVFYLVPTREQLDAYQGGECVPFEEMPGYLRYR